MSKHIIFDVKKKIIQNYHKSAAVGVCAKELKNEFDTAVVNEPSVFEALEIPTVLLFFS